MPSQPGNDDESRKIRRLQIMMNMVMSVISQDTDLTVEEASELVANTKRAALAMFPDNEFAYDKDPKYKGMLGHIFVTKIDKVSRSERAKNLGELHRQLGTAPLPFSAASGEGLDVLWTLIARLSRK